jgi:ribonuclease Z
MISVTFLGVGAALPFPGRTNCCYLIDAGATKILFDCGPAVLQQLASVGRTPGDVTHLFVSHGHGDHALGWPMFLLWWALEGREQNLAPPTVVASTKTWAHLTALWEHSYNDLPPFAVVPVELPADRKFEYQLTPAISLSTWPMIHSTISPVLGARFSLEGKVLAFTADTARCENVPPLASGADLLVHDARYGATVPAVQNRSDSERIFTERSVQSRFHCSARDAGEYASAAGVRNLALIHIGAEYEERHDDLVAEAKTRFSGYVFAPAPGEVFRL